MTTRRNISDIAHALIARGQQGRGARLTPDTAYMVGLKLLTADAKPSRDAIAMLLCDSKCAAPCFVCKGKANIVVRAYGEGGCSTETPK